MIELSFGKSAIEAIEALKKSFGVKTNAEVVSKALYLAQLVADEADEDKTVLIASKEGAPIKVRLAG